MVTLIAVLAVANSLRSDDGENPEYDRALVELTSDLIPGDRDTVRELVEYIVLEKRMPIAEPAHAPVPMSMHVNAVG